MKRPSRYDTANSERSPGVVVRPVAASLWAVFDPESPARCALGHIEAEGGRYLVGLEGEEWEPYSFDSLERGVEWFAEFRSAATLGLKG